MTQRDGLIDGKTLQEWMDAPAGAFGKAVRESIDSKWGYDACADEERQWEVRVDYRYSGRGSAYYTVMARSENEAEVKAEALFCDDDSLDFFDAEVDDSDYSARLK